MLWIWKRQSNTDKGDEGKLKQKRPDFQKCLVPNTIARS